VSVDEQVEELRAQLAQQEQQAKAMQMTIEAKQGKIDQLLKAPSSNQENRQEVASLFEKDIFQLSGNIIQQIDKGDASYTYLHIRQDIQSMQKLIHVAFQAVK
jgi:response regulator of citrate/malate metabolism